MSSHLLTSSHNMGICYPTINYENMGALIINPIIDYENIRALITNMDLYPIPIID